VSLPPPVVSIPSQTLLASNPSRLSRTSSSPDDKDGHAVATTPQPGGMLPTVMEGGPNIPSGSPALLSAAMGSNRTSDSAERNTIDTRATFLPVLGGIGIQVLSAPMDSSTTEPQAATKQGPGPIAEASEPGIRRLDLSEEAGSDGASRKWTWQPKKALMSIIGGGSGSKSPPRSKSPPSEVEASKQDFNRGSQMSRLKTGSEVRQSTVFDSLSSKWEEVDPGHPDAQLMFRVSGRAASSWG